MPAPTISITAFSGEQPRILPRLLPDTAAQSAIDTRLDDGGLTPLRDAPIVDNVGVSATWKSITYFSNNWIGWDSPNIWVAPAPVATDRLYYTDGYLNLNPAGGKPKMRLADGTEYDLAVVAPTTKCAVALGGTATGPDIQSRLYIYTYVTDLNGIKEESAPSPVSDNVDWKPGQYVDLSGLLAPPASPARGITKKRIYRLQTGSAGSYYYFIAEIDAATTIFHDTVPVDATAEPCPSIPFDTPPDGLSGLIALPNGMMAAFMGKQLFFSEPYKPHAWPDKYTLTTEHPIIGLGAVGMTVLVMTDAHPYVVVGSHPDSMVMQKVEQNLACVSHRTIVDMGYAIAYASWEGVVLARSDGSMGVASANLFNREEWEDFNPQTMLCSQLGGRYVAFYSRTLDDGTNLTGAFFVDLGNPVFLFRTSSYADAACFRLERAALYFKPPGKAEIRQIDADNAGRRTLYWKSKPFVLPYAENYGAILIDADDSIKLVDSDAATAANNAVIAANLTLIHNGGLYTWDGKWPVPPGTANYHWQADMDGWATTHPSSASIGGDLDAMPVNEVAFNGDLLKPLPYPLQVVGVDPAASNVYAVMTASVYCDGKIVAGIGKVNKATRLPSGFRGRSWEIDVSTNQRIHKITMAKTMDDLKRTP
jgi:hypothetical protein